MSEVVKVNGDLVHIGKIVVQMHLNADVLMPNGFIVNLSAHRISSAAATVSAREVIAAAAEDLRVEWADVLALSTAANVRGRDADGSKLFYEDDEPWTLGEDEWNGAVWDAEGNLWAHMETWPDNQFMSPQGRGVKEYLDLCFPVSLAGPTWIMDI